MKIFSSKTYNIVLSDSCEASMNKLKQNTDITEFLVPFFTNKAFRGQVSKHKFKIIPTSWGGSNFCVVIGNIDNNIGQIIIRKSDTSKVVFIMMTVIFPIVYLGISPFNNLVIDLSSLLVLIVLFRMLIIIFYFKAMSKSIINRLKEFMKFVVVED